MANISELNQFHRIVVHKIKLSDVEDPDLYVAEPIYQWQQTPQGMFVMNHGQDVSWKREMDMSTMGYAYSILAKFEPKKLTEYYLKFG